MNINNMSKQDLILELEAHGVTLHPATGVPKLKQLLKEVLDGTYKGTQKPVDVKKITKPVIKPVVNLAPKVPELTREERAMAMVRIIVSPNDPLLASQPGMIFTVGSSKLFNGRAVKKFVPFNNEHGWHVPQCIYENIIAAEMQKFKQVKLPNGVHHHVAYIAPKFNVRVLPPLSKEEMSRLADAQKARGGLE